MFSCPARGCWSENKTNNGGITQKQYYEEWKNKANDIWNAVQKYQNEK
jgi:hypothetical protein